MVTKQNSLAHLLDEFIDMEISNNINFDEIKTLAEATNFLEYDPSKLESNEPSVLYPSSPQPQFLGQDSPAFVSMIDAEPQLSSPQDYTQLLPVSSPQDYTQLQHIPSPQDYTQILPVSSPQDYTHLQPVSSPQDYTHLQSIPSPQDYTQLLPIPSPQDYTQLQPLSSPQANNHLQPGIPVISPVTSRAATPTIVLTQPLSPQQYNFNMPQSVEFEVGEPVPGEYVASTSSMDQHQSDAEGPKKRGRRRKYPEGCAPRRHRERKVKVYEMAPLLDEEAEKKRKNAINARRHRVMQKEKLEEVNNMLRQMTAERDRLQQELKKVQLREQELLRIISGGKHIIQTTTTAVHTLDGL